MLARIQNVDDYMIGVNRRLKSVLESAPFVASYYILGDHIHITRYGILGEGKVIDSLNVELRPLEDPSMTISRIKTNFETLNWCSHMIETIPVKVQPRADDIDAEIEKGSSLEDAVVQSSTKSLQVAWIIEKVNERANQILIHKRDESCRFIYAAKIPLTNLLGQIEVILNNPGRWTDNQCEAWDLFKKNTTFKYKMADGEEDFGS